MDGQVIYGVGLIAVPVLLSLTLHEFGHARMAMAFGDHTARLMGRVTLNPLAHLDPLGTLCFLVGPVGWAKPVPVDPTNFRDRRKGEIAVSLAGVGMNLLLLALAAAALNLIGAAGVSLSPAGGWEPTPAGIVAFMLSFLMMINLCLIVFNLIPLYPLDGHHVLRELLPARHRAGFMRFQVRFGWPLLLALLVLPWLIRRATRTEVLSPIGVLLGVVIDLGVDVLLGSGGEGLFLDAWRQYGAYLPW